MQKAKGVIGVIFNKVIVCNKDRCVVIKCRVQILKEEFVNLNMVYLSVNSAPAVKYPNCVIRKKLLKCLLTATIQDHSRVVKNL